MTTKSKIRVCGIMNGTSLDGVDWVMTQIQKSGTGGSPKLKVDFKDHYFTEFPADLKHRIRQAAKHELTVAELGRLHHELGRYYSQEYKKIKSKKKWNVDLVGIHGQTVFHEGANATLQIGEPSYLSLESKSPVVSDFRPLDLASGGQGAPIASLFHQKVLAANFKGKNCAILNLGGIANVTVLDKKTKVLKAFDIGPANMVMDLLIQKQTQGKKTYDKDGEWAAQGIVHPEILRSCLEHPFFKIKPPKSCGREEFGESFLIDFLEKTMDLSEYDQMATLCELTAVAVASALKSFCKPMPEILILCGGGAKNKFLKKRIHYHLQGMKLMTSEDLKWPVDAIEGGAFALLAACRYWHLPSNLPATTGAKQSVSLGKLTWA